MARTYDLFITHGWSYDDSYYRVLDYLDEISNTYEDFEYLNHAVPEADVPSMSYTDELKVNYEDQISKSEAVILLADLYREPEQDELNLKFWIDFAIQHAKNQDLPIFGLRPWSENQTPAEITNTPAHWMNWDPDSIKNTILKHL